MIASKVNILRIQCAFKASGKVWFLHSYRRLVSEVISIFQRAYHDLVTLPGQKPIVSQGPPGYSAVSGHVVTVFGCTGFLGRYLVSKLGEWAHSRISFMPQPQQCHSKIGHKSRRSLP